MDNTTNALNWFEIPAVDIARAQKFYETIFQISMTPMEMGDFIMVTFPDDEMGGKVSGALCKHAMYEPRDNGALIYLNANPDIQTIVDRIEPAGGTVQIPKTQISPEIGYMCVFIDSEGNRMALHAQN
jgi:uncharacterized protein